MKKELIRAAWFFQVFLLVSTLSPGQKKETQSKPAAAGNSLDQATFNALRFRSVGPAITSGRVADIAVNPANPAEYYVAAASGGVWKTRNAGITYEPVFDNEGSYSIGCVSIDPSNPNVVWVGSGENNNQRSVAYGDGIYKSEDGGKSWKNMGLKNSEHIGRITIDPRNPDMVYVAAYGPLWNAGGDRGIYKTTDGGKTWTQVLKISDNTGCNDILMDPRNSNVLYAAAHQRRRQVYTYISGGPESAVYKSTDAGATWSKLSNGLPTADMGRIGLAISPVNPDYVYAIIESTEKNGGVFRSTDRGASWEKRGDNVTAGNYYQEIFCDPKDVNKVYYVDFWVMQSNDGGKTFAKIGEKFKHVDNHALWIDPDHTDHLLVGCDGGLYETRDHGANWEFKDNLPVTQFYKVATDNDFPFYNIYGGTQDNNSLGGPSRTISANGITNSDWFITNEGDGFESQIDQEDPNTVYAQSQYGGLVRYNRKTGETVDIRPIEGANDPAMRWNWDSPLLISSHSHTRLYFGSNILFRTDDKGNSWKAISGDLSRQLDRNRLPLMGRVWSMDAVAKNQSTDFYGNLVSIAENFFDENTLYTGTDDGLIHVTHNGGGSWEKMDRIPGVPDRSYVNQIIASRHHRSTIFVAFNHHRYGDFKPYLLKSTDDGKTWVSISGNLPERGSVYCMAEDHKDPNLLFAGTEFGVFFTTDGGQQWTRLKGGLPVVAVRDMEIQRREDDLVLGTFGRGFYILEDYSLLRNLKKSDLDKTALLFPVKDAWMFNHARRWGHPGKAFQGEAFYSTPNPPIAAVFTYYLKEDIKTIKEKRREAEKEKIKKGEDVFYPSWDSIRLEDNQPAPYLLLTVSDEAGNSIRRIKTGVKKGLNRVNWNFRYDSPGPVNFNTPDPSNPYDVPEEGHLVMPGKYNVTLSKFEDGRFTELAGPVSFTAKALNWQTATAVEQEKLLAFARKVSSIRRAAAGASEFRNELSEKLKFLRAAAQNTPSVPAEVTGKLYEIDGILTGINNNLNGDASLARREKETVPSINGRIESLEYSLWNATATPTQTSYQSYQVAAGRLPGVLKALNQAASDLEAIENTLEQKGAPYTPGRLPVWTDQ